MVFKHASRAWRIILGARGVTIEAEFEICKLKELSVIAFYKSTKPSSALDCRSRV